MGEGQVSRGADTKANILELVREADGLLERLQRRVAPESLCKSRSSFGAEADVTQTASRESRLVLTFNRP